jgi:hypothetical protein
VRGPGARNRSGPGAVVGSALHGRNAAWISGR